jgi:hypothetical protein
MTKRRLTKAVGELDIRKKDEEYEIPGALGFLLNGEQTVEVPTRDSFVFVRLRNNNNELIQAFNDQVSPVYDLPVLVVRDTVDKGRYKVVGRDLGQYSNWGSSTPYLARHGNQHSFNPDSGGGGDIVWVFGRQFMPLLGYPSGSSAAGGIIIHSYTYYDGSSWNYVGNTGTVDLTTYKPTGSNARIVLVYINESGNPDYRAGSFFDESITGTAEIVPYIPNPPTGTAFPVSAVRLVSGTSTISWGNLYDVRPFYDLSGTSSGLGGAGGGAPDDASYITLGLDGDLLAERQLVTGTHTTITDGGANASVAINVSPQGAGSGLDSDTVDGWDAGDFASGSHTHYQASILDLQHAIPITEDGVFQATGTAIDFGENMNVAVTGSVVFVSSIDTVGGGGGGDLLIYDNSVFNVTGTAISFDDNLDVSVTGSTAYIEATGVTGSAGAAGPPGDNTLLIYEDNAFEVTGTAMSFGDNMDVVVTGSVAYVSSAGGTGTSADHAYYSKLASFLEPDAIEPLQWGGFYYGVGSSETKYLLFGWQARIGMGMETGTSGRIIIRDPVDPLPLRNVVVSGIFNESDKKSSAVILDPTLPTYTDARETYFDRLNAITTYDTKYIGFNAGDVVEPMLPGAYGAIITHVTSNDLAWVAIFGPRTSSYAVGYPIDYEIGDTTADYMRFSHNMFIPINKQFVSTVESQPGTAGPGQLGGALTYVLLPSTWSVISDPLAPYDFRDDFMGSSLDVASTWTRSTGTNSEVEINTLYQWCKIKGNNSWGQASIYSQSSVSRASGTVFLADLFIDEEVTNYTTTNVILGFSDGGGHNFSNFSHGLYFSNAGAGSPTLFAFETGTNRGTVGSGYRAGNIYRVRITLENNAAKYEIQGGSEYPSIGDSSWEDISPTGTSSSVDPLYAGISQNATANNYWSDPRIYT